MPIDEQLIREVIMDHYEHPRHNSLLNDPSYITVRLKNPSCGDDLTVQCQFSQAKDKSEQEAKISDIRQKGSGCSICLASASMMAELLNNSSIKEAETALANFTKMVQADDYESDVLGDAQALSGISHVIPRIKCANLAWQALKAAIDAHMSQEANAKGKANTSIEMEINE